MRTNGLGIRTSTCVVGTWISAPCGRINDWANRVICGKGVQDQWKRNVFDLSGHTWDVIIYGKGRQRKFNLHTEVQALG